MNIVFVDNNTSTLSFLAKEIAEMFPEYCIQTFADPLMSAKYICNNEVDLAFLAATMRPVDGFILLRTLRANKPSMPIVMLLDSEEQREKAFCETLNDGLVKPVSSQLLIAAVKQILPLVSNSRR